MSGKIKLLGVYDYTVILTYISLLSAIVGIINAVQGKFGFAILCLLFSGVCDAFDGIVARTKKNRTEREKQFGIQIDSLCDVVSFGVFPCVLGYFMGADGIIGIIIIFAYVLCAVIRLAYFNVLENERQKTESGCAKFYKGLPVTTSAVIFPVIYCLNFIMPKNIYAAVYSVVMILTAFLFVLDFSVPKPDWIKILKKVFAGNAVTK